MPSIRCLWLLVFCLLATFQFPATAQEAALQDEPPFVFRAWKSEDGLPHNSVTAITQTPDGYLWLGTYNGLARFDGVHCRVFGLKDGLRSLQITHLLLDSHGRLWIGTTGGGVSWMDHGQIKTLTLADGLAGDTINALLEDKEGVIWIGTTAGLSQWKDGSLLPVYVGPKSEHLAAMALDHSGAVWLATVERSLFRINPDHTETSIVPPNRPLIQALMVDHNNNLWVAAPGGMIYCRHGDTQKWTTFGPTNGLPDSMVKTFAESSDGTIWAGTLDQGLYYLRDGHFMGLSTANGLPNDAIYTLFVDQNQFVWAGTRAGGLCRLTPRRIYNLRVLENGVARFPHSLAETPDGTLWVGTAGRGLFQWDGTAFNQFLRKPPLNGHWFVETVLATSDGSLWWGAGPAIYQWKENHLVHYFDATSGPWLRGARVTALCENPAGGMWVGSHNGELMYLTGTNFASVGQLGGQPVTDIVRQHEGTMWVATLGGGLVRFQNGTQRTFTTSDGLGSPLVEALFLDHNDDLWIGTMGGGLGRWKNGKFEFFASQQGLADESILEIVEDNMGNLWLGCDHGIMRLSRMEIENAAGHSKVLLHPQMLGWREGMLTEQCVLGFKPALKSSNGKLLFCTTAGIVVVDPNQPITKASPPRVILEKITVDGNDETSKFSPAAPLPFDQHGTNNKTQAGTEIAPGPQVVKFQFTGLSFDAPELVQFRYQLQGVDSGWVDAGNERSASYAHLPPGHYNFHVIACNAQGVWNQTGASVQFTVLPFFWQRGWFTALVFATAVLLSVGVILYGIRRQYRRRLKFLEMERATENERARIARDLHDEVGSSLTRISMLSDQIQARSNDPEQLKVRALKLSDFAVRTTRAFEEIVWAANPRNDSLRSLLEYLTHFANELFEDSSIICRFLIPDDLPEITLPPETRHGIFLVIKETLNNALKHSGASHVSLRAELDSRSLLITVQDDGKGFETRLLAKDEIEQNGLPNMRQRIEHLGGQFEIETRSGVGTTIRIRLSREKLLLPKPGAKR